LEENMPPRRHTPLLVWAAAAAIVAGVCRSAPAAVIYGGPTYDTTTSIGYQNPFMPITPGATSGDGVAVGSAQYRYSASTPMNFRAVRWDASGAAATELGNLGTDGNGDFYSYAYAVNATGTAVGAAGKYTGGTYAGSRAVRWGAGGVAATELGNLGTDSTGRTTGVSYAINASGTAVGAVLKYTAGTDAGTRAVRWDAGSTAATELGNLGTSGSGSTNGYAYAISASGTAVGYAQKYTAGTFVGNRAVRWDAGGTAATELGNLGTDGGGNTASIAFAISATGTAVGEAEKYNGSVDIGPRAVRWGAGGAAATELGNLGTDGSGNTSSGASAVNATGTAVGVVSKYMGGTYAGSRAVRWDAGGTAATELGNLGTDGNGITNTFAYAVNATGMAVGAAEKYNAGTLVAGQRAVAWGTDGVALDLNAFLSPADAALWTLSEANGISDTGWITGVGTYDPDGAGPLPFYSRAFLIQVPEPSSLALIAIGGLFLRRRRQCAE
jgi:hypothetical protein